MKRFTTSRLALFCCFLLSIVVIALWSDTSIDSPDQAGPQAPPSSDFITPSSEPIRQARLLIDRSQLREAEVLLKGQESVGDALNQVQASCSLAESLIRSSDYQKAEAQLDKCKERISLNSPHGEMEAYAHHLSGFLAQMTGQYSNAIAEYEAALKIEAQLSHSQKAPLLNTLNNLGNVYYRLGRYDVSEQLHLEVLKRRKALYGDAHPKVAASLGNLGNTYEAAGRPMLSLQYHEQALSIWNSFFGEQGLQASYSLNNIGFAALKIGDHDRAISALLDSYQIKQSILGGDNPDVAGTLQNLAKAYLENGNLDLAQKTASQALLIYANANLQNLPKYSFTIETLSQVHLLRGNAPEAKSILESEISRISGHKDPAEVSLLNTLGKICQTQGDYHCAENSANKAIQINLGHRNEAPVLALSVLQQSSSISKLVESLFIRAQALAAEANETDSLPLLRNAFDAFELAFAFSHNAISENTSRKPAFEPVADIENELKQFLVFALKMFPRHNDDDLGSRLFNIIDVYNGGILLAGLRRIHSNSSSIGSLISSYNSISPQELNPGHSIIEYFELEERLWCVIVNESGHHYYDLGRLDLVQEVATSLSDYIVKRDLQATIDYAARGYDLLIKPIESVINNDAVTIVPSTSVKRIPFEVLVSKPNVAPDSLGQPRPRFLIEEKRVSYAYSAALLELQSQKGQQAFKKTMLAIAPVFDWDANYSTELNQFLRKFDSKGNSFTLAPLPGSAEEVVQIGKILSDRIGLIEQVMGNSVDVLLREDSDEHAFKTTNLSEYRYLHFATHSFVDQDQPDSSGIILDTTGGHGEDGILFAAEVFNLELGAELVVLSSCDSGVDGNSTSFELSGFAKGFIQAGAQNLIASIWPSDDVGTQVLMQRFYAHLATGVTSSDALRKAKIDLINMGGPIANPYFWGGFIHLGAPGAVKTSTASRLLRLN